MKYSTQFSFITLPVLLTANTVAAATVHTNHDSISGILGNRFVQTTDRCQSVAIYNSAEI